ncbi:succinate-semialdehyde mitochondrial [Brachionus plicatilis]|uniref:Succinate-semialdehyde dehydrogenase, mitochondrial n=1 Tax=Brachionus plicatilis TaxID=10195 RepID=A0A3M7P7W6_BRAPC|nr:succinate-semialdehyde mitochondrial [Brachionus plicatilis]
MNRILISVNQNSKKTINLNRFYSNRILFKQNVQLLNSSLQISGHHCSAQKFNYFPEKAYINGKWTDSITANKFEIFDPAKNTVLGSVPDCNLDDLNQAVQSANQAFKVWSNFTSEQRSRILRKLYDLHIEYKQQLAEIITHENGKPLRESLVEIDSSAKAYEWFSEEAKRTYGDLIPSPAPNKRFLVLKQPVGICGFITPWNFPAYMIARKTAAALAAGCTVVIKPAEDTPYSALALCQLSEMAGLPAGCINVVTTSRKNTAEMGKAICHNPLVKKISFTGSTAVGKIILENCAHQVKKVQMELGGNAPFIVFDSADIKKAIVGLMASKFRNSGQTCVCANRIFVQEGIYDKFIIALAEEMKKQLKVGNGFETDVTQGPLINKNAITKVENLVKDSIAKGGQIVLGGSKCDLLGGNFYEPTLIRDVTTEMEIAKEEIFGPVAAIMKFKDEEDAVRLANAVSVGLAGYFYSSDLSQIWRVAEKLEVGMVGVNEGIVSTIEAPFGGIKESGFGSEGSNLFFFIFLIALATMILARSSTILNKLNRFRSIRSIGSGSILYAKEKSEKDENFNDFKLVQANLPVLVKPTVFQKMKEIFGYQGDLRYPQAALTMASLRLYLSIQYQVDYDKFFQKCQYPDVMYSFCLVTFLHVWLVSVALMQYGRSGLFVRKLLHKNMWKDIETREKKLNSPMNRENKAKAYGHLNDIFRAFLFGFDEGLLSDDTVLAGAIWRHLLEMQDIKDHALLGELCDYIRKNAQHLENISDVDILKNGIVSFVGFDQKELDHSKNFGILKFLIGKFMKSTVDVTSYINLNIK